MGKKYDNTGADFGGDPDAEIRRRKADDDFRRAEQDRRDAEQRRNEEIRRQNEQRRGK